MSNETEIHRDNLEIKLARLEGLLDSTNRSVDGIHNSERKSLSNQTVLIGFFIAFFTVGSVSFQVWTDSRIEKVTSQAEQRISNLVGSYKPKKAWVHGLDGPRDETINLEMYITPEKMGDIIYYQLRASGGLIVKIDGASGRLTGILSQIQGIGAKIFNTSFDGTPDIVAMQTQKLGNCRTTTTMSA